MFGEVKASKKSEVFESGSSDPFNVDACFVFFPGVSVPSNREKRCMRVYVKLGLKTPFEQVPSKPWASGVLENCKSSLPRYCTLSKFASPSEAEKNPKLKYHEPVGGGRDLSWRNSRGRGRRRRGQVTPRRGRGPSTCLEDGRRKGEDSRDAAVLSPRKLGKEASLARVGWERLGPRGGCLRWRRRSRVFTEGFRSRFPPAFFQGRFSTFLPRLESAQGRIFRRATKTPAETIANPGNAEKVSSFKIFTFRECQLNKYFRFGGNPDYSKFKPPPPPPPLSFSSAVLTTFVFEMRFQVSFRNTWSGPELMNRTGICYLLTFLPCSVEV